MFCSGSLGLYATKQICIKLDRICLGRSGPVSPGVTPIYIYIYIYRSWGSAVGICPLTISLLRLDVTYDVEKGGLSTK